MAITSPEERVEIMGLIRRMLSWLDERFNQAVRSALDTSTFDNAFREAMERMRAKEGPWRSWG